MAAGDLALQILISATDMASEVVVSMASTFDSAFQSMVDSTAMLNSAFASVDEQLLTTAAAVDELAASTDSAAVSFGSVDDSASGLDAILAAIQDQTDMLDTALYTLATSADDAAVSLGNMDATLAEMDGALATTAVEADSASGSFDILSIAEDGAAASAAALGAALKIIAISLGVLTLVGAAVAGVSAKMAADFQSGITSLMTGAGELQSNLKMVSDGILQMAVDTGTSTKQLVDGMYMIESGGFHGAQGLTILKAAAEGAKVGNADLGVVADATDTILKNFGDTGLTAANAVNTLIATVAHGKTHMEDLANSLSQVLPTAAAARIGLNDVMAAMATMTGEGVDAANAATYLRQTIIALEAPAPQAKAALAAIGLTSAEVAAEMQKSLPGALKMITDHLKAVYGEGTPAYVEALKNIAGGSKQMQGILDLTGTHLKTFGENVNLVANQVRQGGNSIVGWSAVQATFNQRMDQTKSAVEALLIKIGTPLLGAFGGILDKINPVIKAFGDWLDKTHAVQNGINAVSGVLHQIADAFNQVFNPVQKTAAVMKPLADSFDRATGIFHQVKQAVQPLLDTFDRAHGIISSTAKTVNPMLDSFDRASGVFNKTGTSAHGTVQAVNPFVGLFQNIKNIIQAVTPVIQGIGTAIQFVGQHWSQIQSVMQTAGNIISTVIHAVGVAIDFVKQHIGQVLPIFQAVGNFLSSTFAPVWQKLVQSFGDIQRAIQPILPQLQQFGMFLGAVIGVAIVLIIGLIAGLVSAFAGLLTGVIQVVTGIIQFFSGLVQFFSGIFAVITDIFSGNWGKIAADLNNAMNGIMNMFIGVWNIIAGIFSAAFGMIQGFASGFVSTVVGIFQGFADTIVGHSIIPDMVNSIIDWFTQLPGRAVSAVQGLASQLTGFFGGLASQAISWGSNIIQGLVNGINSMVGSVSGAIGNIASIIGSFLPHSPAKQGELSHLNEYGPNLVKGFADGITRSHPIMHSAMRGLTGIMAPTSLASSGSAGSGNAFALSGSAGNAFALGNGGQTIIIQVQPAKADITMDHRKVGEGVMQYAQKEIRLQGTVRNR
ncbi:MAG: phage tail tape measure protein [Ktedonobacteraceae bacterium]